MKICRRCSLWDERTISILGIRIGVCPLQPDDAYTLAHHQCIFTWRKRLWQCILLVLGVKNTTPL